MRSKTLEDRLRELAKYKQDVERSYGEVGIVQKQKKLIEMQQELISYMEGYIDYLREDKE